MSKPVYRLASVLQLRLRAKEEVARLVTARRKELVEAEAELARRKQAVRVCQSQLIAAQERMFDTASSGIEACRFADFRTHLADLRETERQLQVEMEKQQLAVSRADQELDKTIASLNEANKQASIIEKHRERWKRQIQLELQRREEKISDEIGSILYERTRKLLRP